ncbi:MAG: DUF4157 domain-containing protein [Mariniphaga sp.]|nr:DUF4157 domain-containing protein [Mariniphaga sp.]
MKATAEKSSHTTATSEHQKSAQPFFAKAGGGDFFAPVSHSSAPSLQTKLTVNKPGDKFEQEADKMADKVMRMPAPELPVKEEKVQKVAAPEEKIQKASLSEEKVQKKEEEKVQKAALPEEKIQKKEEEKIQKASMPEEKVQKKEEEKLQRAGGDGTSAVATATQSAIQSKTTGGQPLSSEARSYMEPRFNANFGNVRIHNDPESAGLSNQLSARAFTYQNHVFFSRDQYQPGTGEGKHLLAHELTHTIQQGHAIKRSPQVTTTATPPPIQRLGIQDALDYFADKAYYIPGFRMLTILMGFNPINMRATDRSAANILRALIELIPGGHFITQALDNHGVFTKAGAWVEQQINTLGNIGGEIVSGLKQFIDSLSWRDIFDLSGVWERAKRIFTNPIGRLISFAGSVVTGLLKLVKDAVLKPLAALAQGTRGYDLLKAVLGEDPITGEPVPRNAETLIGGFMKLIGQEEVWENIKKGNAIARAWVWFQGALGGLMGFVRAIPRRIIDTITSLTFQDIITVVGALGKIIGAFVNIASDFISWGLNQVLSLLEIIFSVVAPGVMPYIKKAQAAFTTIIKNPIGFVNNLVRAGKLGFEKFASNIVTHLKTALIKWITGPLGEAGVYIPQSFSLMEIIKLVLSVLGLTWQNIRSKLVKIIPEPVLVVLEKTAGILVTLVKDGPAAAWEQIKTELSELKDQMIAKVTEMISTEVVKAAIMKLVSMLNPAGAVIQAIIAIYNTITFFIQKINQIASVVASFIDSISAIASGQVENAAKKVEQTMANTLTIIIAFLAKFAGLGNIPEKIVGIINKIRQPIDKGLDKIVGWLGGMLKKLTSSVAQAGLPADPKERFRQGLELAETAVNKFAGRKVGKLVLTPLLIGIKTRYGFQVLDVFSSGGNWWIDAILNPADKKKTYVEVENADLTGKQKKMPLMTVNFQVKASLHKNLDNNNISLWTHYVDQIRLQENKLKQLTIQSWMANVNAFYGNKSLKIKKQGRSTVGDARAKQLRNQLVNQKAAELRSLNPKLTINQALMQALDFWSDQAILHVLDQGAGGEGTELVGDLIDGGAVLQAYLGNARVDYSIGAKWPARVRVLKTEIENRVDPTVFATEKMNVELKAEKQ